MVVAVSSLIKLHRFGIPMPRQSSMASEGIVRLSSFSIPVGTLKTASHVRNGRDRPFCVLRGAKTLKRRIG